MYNANNKSNKDNNNVIVSNPKLDNKFLFWCDQNHDSIIDQIYWPYKPHGPHNSKHLFDIYSLTHLWWVGLSTLLGIWVFGKIKPVPMIIFVLSTVFEIFENLPSQIVKYRRIEIDKSGNTSYRGDSLINIIGDIIFNVIGILLSWYFSSSVMFGVLLLSFALITNVVGINYWIEFLQFIGIKHKKPQNKPNHH